MLLTRTFHPWRATSGAWQAMDRLRQEMDRVMGSVEKEPGPVAQAGVFPLINASEDKDNYLVRAEIPGLAPEDVHISIEGKKLSLTGERKQPELPEGALFHRKERSITGFSRVLSLPADVDADKVTAKCQNGVLFIILPKAEAAKPRQITVSGN